MAIFLNVFYTSVKMKTKKTLLKYFNKLAKKLNKSLTKPSNKYEEEDYHTLRVEVKQLNALLYLADFCAAHFNRKKYFRQAEKIFKQSGKVREFQLEVSTLKKFASFSVEHYLSDVKDHIQKAENRFHSVVSKKRKLRVKKDLKKIASLLTKIHKKKMKLYLKKESEKIHDIMRQKPLHPLQVHELRKRLKVDFYTKKSLHLADDRRLKEEDSFQELLGKWHDSRSVNDLLEKSIIKEKIDAEELKQLLEIHEEILFNSKKLLEEINSRLDGNRL